MILKRNRGAQRQHLEGMRRANITHLRATFASHGMDVSSYTDADLSRAVLDEAPDSASHEDLLSRIFARLVHPLRPKSARDA